MTHPVPTSSLADPDAVNRDSGASAGLVAAAERIEREAYRDLFLAAPPELAARHGIETAEVGGATCTVAAALDVALSMLNRIIGLGLERPARRADIVAIADWFAARRADAFAQLAPPAAEQGLEPLLATAGFEPGYAWMKFVRGVRPPPEERPRVRVRAVERDEATVFGSTVARSFAMPSLVADWLAPLVGRAGWRCYLAFDGDEPAGAAAVFVSGRVGWLGFGSVLPSHRGKGAQRALLDARIRAAGELGCELLVTETGEQQPGKPGFSYENILKAGFREAYRRPALVRRAP